MKKRQTGYVDELRHPTMPCCRRHAILGVASFPNPQYQMWLRLAGRKEINRNIEQWTLPRLWRRECNLDEKFQ